MGMSQPSQRPREGTKNGHAPRGGTDNQPPGPALDGPQSYPRK